MSWQEYVDNNMVGTGKITRGAILGLDGGGSVWAKSSDLNITDQEVKALVGSLADPSQLFGSGIHLNGTKYMTIQADGDQIIGKKGPKGLCCYKSDKALLLGEYEGAQPGDANKVVGELADYLKSVGY